MKIGALDEPVKRQVAQIRKKLEGANVQVQAIAVKAIEGASNARALSTINEIAMEQAKNIRDKR